MDAIVECPKCGMRMTEHQMEWAVACTTEGCPLPKPDAAGRRWTDATDTERKKMTGIIIGQKPEKVRASATEAEAAYDAFEAPS